MSNESRIRDRIRFQEVAKLADTAGRGAERAAGQGKSPGAAGGASEPASESEKKEDSGMIDLAAIVAGEGKSPATSTSTSTPAREALASARPSSPPVSSSGVKTKQSLLSWSPSASALPAPGPGATATATSRSAFAGAAPTAEGGVLASAHVAADTTRPTTRAAGSHGEKTRWDERDETGAGGSRDRGSSTMWIALVGGIAVGALSAIVAFKLHDGQGARSGDPHAQVAAASPAPAAPGPSSGEWTATTAARGGPADRGVDLATLPSSPPSPPPPPPAAAATPAAMGHATSALVHAVGAAPEPAAPAPPAAVAPAAPAARGAQPAHAAAAADTPPADPNSLEAMMKRAVRSESPQAPSSPPPTPAPAAPQAAAPPANVPLKPAMGAVMGALGAVLPAARYCLGPDDPVSRATITFLSDGSVETVAIAGDAAGQPAEACIRARLMDARVPPFANPRFTWTVPVRPAN
jgi:hypothetical protein